MWCNYCDNDEDVCPYCKNNTDLDQQIVSPFSYPSYPTNRIKDPLHTDAEHYIDDVDYQEDLFEQSMSKYDEDGFTKLDKYDDEDFRVNGNKQPTNSFSAKTLWLILIAIVLCNVMTYFCAKY